MSLTTGQFALFLHIALVIVSFCAAGLLHAGLLLMRSARDVAEIRAWPRVIATTGRLLPVSALLLLGTGAWLLHLSGGEFGWSQGWVIASLTGLLVVEAVGASVGPRSAALQEAVTAAAPGPVSAALRRQLLDPVLWAVLHGGTAVFLAIVFLMVVKPSGVWSAGIVAVVGVLGAASGLPFTRRPGEPAAAPEPRRVVDVTERDETWTRPRS